MSKRELEPIGEWTFHDHRMARFEDRRVFSWVVAADDEGKRWSWVVMLPGRDPEERTKGEAETPLAAAQAADAVAGDAIETPPAAEQVDKWAARHLQWRGEVDASETEATKLWNRHSE